MNPQQVRAWEEVESWLRSKGFVPTYIAAVGGGQIWQSKSKKNIVVPDPIDGFYPEVFWNDLVRRANLIIP